MSERGFIALARGVLDHPIVGVKPRTPFSQTEAWQWLLFEAAFKPRRYQAGSIVVELQRGQLAHSTRYMAQAWRWPETNVRRFLERLKTGAGTGAMIGAESGAGITVITICNYEHYQSPQEETGAESGAPSGAVVGAKMAHDRRRKEQLNNETIEEDVSLRSEVLDVSRGTEPEVAKYTFESGVIRLKAKDFNNWKEAYAHLDLRAELLSLTQWAETQGKNWFFAVSGALAKRNREQKLRLDQARTMPGGVQRHSLKDPLAGII